MRIAHLILAHKSPDQLERLIRRLTHPQSDVFIHLDAKTNYHVFAPLALLPNIRFIKYRHNVTWGGFSLTQAALEGFREIIRSPVSYDFINLMSGEDYLIKPPEAIHDFLKEHIGYSFLEYYSYDSEWWQINKSRITQYHLNEFAFPGKYIFQELLNYLLPSRIFPLFNKIYGGNMGGWYTLSRDCAAYLVNFMDMHPQLKRFAKLTWGSDEFLIHTILLNSSLSTSIINNNLRYIDWSHGGSSPKILTIDDLPSLRSSTRLFARKFDIKKDTIVLDQLDQIR